MSKLNLFIDSPLITVFIQNMFRFENPYSLGLFSSLMLPQYAECNFLNYCGHSPLESNNISSTGKASVLPAPMPAAQLAISNFLEKTLHLQQLKAMALSENGLMKKPCSPPDAGGAAAGATTAGSGGGKRRARCGTKKHGTSIVSTDAAEAVAEAGVKSNSFTIDAILQKPKAVNSSSHKTRRVQCSDHVTNGDCDGLMSPFLDGVVCFPPTMGPTQAGGGGLQLTSQERSGSAWRTRLRGKRVRTIFTSEQLERLEEEFTRQQYMVGTERYYLAATLNLSEAQVKVWFQNRRIKWRKQMLSRPLHHQTQTAAAASSSTRLQSATNCSSSSPQSHLAESDDVSDADVDDMSNSESEFDGNMDNDGMEKEEEGVAEKNGINECNESSNSQQEFEV